MVEQYKKDSNEISNINKNKYINYQYLRRAKYAFRKCIYKSRLKTL